MLQSPSNVYRTGSQMWFSGLWATWAAFTSTSHAPLHQGLALARCLCCGKVVLPEHIHKVLQFGYWFIPMLTGPFRLINYFSSKGMCLCIFHSLAGQASFQYVSVGINVPIASTPCIEFTRKGMSPVYISKPSSLKRERDAASSGHTSICLCIFLQTIKICWCLMQALFYGLDDALRFIIWPRWTIDLAWFHMHFRHRHKLEAFA